MKDFPYPIIKEFPVDDLAISDLNPRKTVDADSITSLAESIRVCGLMQNLAGLVMGDDMVLIVAGGRRLRALQQLRASGDWPPDKLVPVLLTDDITEARAWAMAENTARADLNPADEIGAYAAMATAGQGIPAIAAAFGVTELQVQRRLKLATLENTQLAALRAGEINLSQAASLLMCGSDAQREEYLSRARQGWDSDQLRRAILNDKVTGDDRRVRFIGLDEYRLAGGALTSDLFSSNVVIEDVPLLDRLFAEAIERQRAAYIADGWRWADFHEGTYLASWELSKGMARVWPKPRTLDEKSQLRYEYLTNLEELDAREEAELEAYERFQEPTFTDNQRSVSGLFFCVGQRGGIQVERGYVRREDKPDAVALGLFDSEELSPATPEDTDSGPAGKDAGFSQALLADLQAIRLSALQEAILSLPGLTRTVLAYGLTAGDARPFDVMIRNQPNTPSVTDGWMQAQELERDVEIENWQHANSMSLDELTLALSNRLIRGLIYGLGYGNRASPAWENLLHRAAPDLRARWRPTKDNFFGRVPVAYLDQLYYELFDLDPAHHDAREFAKMKKGEKANLLHMLFDPDGSRAAYRLMNDTTLARIDAWVPEFE